MGDGVEGFWIVRYQGGWAGVVVLETQKFFGGDSMYGYIGSYRVSNGVVTATARVDKYTEIPGGMSIFGDAAQTFQLEIVGTVFGGVLTGKAKRLDNGVFVECTLSDRVDLP